MALRRTPLPTHWPSVTVAGVCFGTHQLLFIAASQQTSIAVVTLLQGSMPLIIALVSRRLLGERLPGGLVTSNFLAVAGVALVVLANQSDRSHSPLGDCWAVLNLGAFLLYFLAGKRARDEGTGTLSLTGWSLIIAAMVVSPFFLLGQGGSGPVLQPWQLALLAFHALVPGNGHLLMNWAHPRLSAALSSLLLSLIPVLASLWAYLLLDEPYGAFHFVGTGLAIAAIELGRRSVSRPQAN